jgi:hypothetical protein
MIVLGGGSMQPDNPWGGLEQAPQTPSDVGGPPQQMVMGQVGQPMFQPQQIVVGQPMQTGMMNTMMVPATSATTALVLSILSVFCGGICLAIPALIVANSALNITNQFPGHQDAGTAKAAQVISWVVIVLTGLFIIFYVLIFAAAVSTDSGY